MTTDKNTPATSTGSLPAEALQPNWGAIEHMETTDLLVPKIFHQQGLSEFVKQGVARPGDWCDSLTGEVLAKKENSLQIIIFGSYKDFAISKQVGNTDKFKLDKIIKIQPENALEFANKPMVENTPEGMVKNSLRYNFYCLVPSKINELPFVLTLSSTKAKVARKINTMLYKANSLKIPGPSIVFALSSIEEKNDRGSWWGVDVRQARKAEPEELLRAYAWYQKSQMQTFSSAEEDQAGAHEE